MYSNMNIFNGYLVICVWILFFSNIKAFPQPEINDQFEDIQINLTKQESADIDSTTTAKTIPDTAEANVVLIIDEKPVNVSTRRNDNATKLSLTSRVYYTLSAPIVRFVSTPKVNAVLRNIGTCVVNGVLEIVTYFFPAPLIPLIASAAGMVIPFEPVVLLKERMPVTSYRRAFNTAMNTFLSTFDKYKIDDMDPYMTRRFNRRLNGDTKGDFSLK